jgi:hypothetical protein
VRNEHTNVVLINASGRFDFSGSSCVNEEGSAFPKNLIKIGNKFDNVYWTANDH